MTAANGTPAGEMAQSLALPWVVWLRYIAVVGQLAAVLTVQWIFGEPMPMAWLAVPISITALSNLLIHSGVRGCRIRPQHLLAGIFILDTLTLTAVLALTGGPENPFSSVYLLQIMLSAVILRKFWTWTLGLLAVTCFGLLFWIHRPLVLLEAHHGDPRSAPHLVGMWIAFALSAMLTSFFVGKVSEALRRREHEMARSERLASLVTLAAGAAHELGTPLATIAVVAKELERYAGQSKAAELAEDAALIRAEVERCRAILEEMSARGGEHYGEAPAPVRLPELLDAVAAQFPDGRVRTSVTSGSAVRAVDLPQRAAVRTLSALVKNALDASNQQQEVTLAAEFEGERIRFVVRDQGRGMNEEVLERIGEPFFTTKPPGRGMGLGTFLARLFAERLGGELKFSSHPARGTVVTLDIPAPKKEHVSA